MVILINNLIKTVIFVISVHCMCLEFAFYMVATVLYIFIDSIAICQIIIFTLFLLFIQSE